MHVYLFRHGIAMDRQPGMTDADRPLTHEGIEKTRRAAAGWARAVDAPQIILTSPRQRAAQTAELAAEILGASVEVAHALGEQNVRAIIDVLEERDEDRVMVVGHEPTLSELAELLCFGQVFGRLILKKAGGIAITTEGLPRSGSGTLQWLATGKMLRKLA